MCRLSLLLCRFTCMGKNQFLCVNNKSIFVHSTPLNFNLLKAWENDESLFYWTLLIFFANVKIVNGFHFFIYIFYWNLMEFPLCNGFVIFSKGHKTILDLWNTIIFQGIIPSTFDWPFLHLCIMQNVVQLLFCFFFSFSTVFFDGPTKGFPYVSFIVALGMCD